MVIKINFL